jgi:hypothetical protein
MTRISLEEAYDNKDVITQIVKLKDGLNEANGGIIEDIDIINNELVIDWADGTSISLPLPDPVTGISSVTGSVAGGNLTITFYFTNGTTHSFTCALTGMATTQYVDDGLALKANASDVYDKTEVYTKLETDALVAKQFVESSEIRTITSSVPVYDLAEATIPKTGRYTIHIWDASDPFSSGYALLGYNVNSTSGEERWLTASLGCLTDYDRNTASICRTLNAGDVVRVCYYQTSGSNLSTSVIMQIAEI